MDFLSIGGTVVDTFIKLNDENAKVICGVHEERCELSMHFADKVPFEFSKVVPAVGNSANAAVAAARLGLATGYITGLGDDRGGKDCLEVFKSEGISTEYITVSPGQATPDNYVLWYQHDRTILVKYADFGYDIPNPFPKTRSLYISSISEHNLGIHDKIADWLDTDADILFVFQPATFQIKAGVERLKRNYARANVFICNKEEYQRILSTEEDDVKKLMQTMRTLGPKIVFLTDGPNGAYAMSDEGAWKIGLYPDGKNAYERTGAGDAFASTVTAAILLGKTVPEALAWGPVNSAFVVQKIGAQEGLLSREALEDYLRKAPADYVVSPL